MRHTGISNKYHNRQSTKQFSFPPPMFLWHVSQYHQRSKSDSLAVVKVGHPGRYDLLISILEHGH